MAKIINLAHRPRNHAFCGSVWDAEGDDGAWGKSVQPQATSKFLGAMRSKSSSPARSPTKRSWQILAALKGKIVLFVVGNDLDDIERS